MRNQLHPNWEKVNFHSPSFVSYRRLWLDYFLNHFSNQICGRVVDLGGKRQNKRGSFEPPVQQTSSWWYINLELNTRPNIYANVEAVPLASESADVVLCTEVLEHIHNPQTCVNEIWRILKSGGVAFISVPFMYPIHADPFDFQRFTDMGLKYLFDDFSCIETFPMGGYLGVMGMFVELGWAGIKGQQIHNKILRRLLAVLAKWLYKRDLASEWQPDAWEKFTTGYFVRVIK